MKKSKTVVNEAYAGLSDCLHDLPQRFGKEGRLLFKARNEVRLVEYAGCRLAVKRYASAGLFRKAVSLFRQSKAYRSYRNALVLAERDIPTPAPVAYMEKRNRWGCLTDSYYVCLYIDMPPIKDGLNEQGGDDFNCGLTRSFACFVVSLHEKGVFHHDLNETNVRFLREGEAYRFALIDLNRMTIYAPHERVSVEKCLLNISRFSSLSAMFRAFVVKYLSARGLPPDFYAVAMAVKKRNDRRYARKKKVTGFLKNLVCATKS